jgi:hypothetical protein
MRQAIHAFLHVTQPGLPESYGESEIDAKASAFFEHMYRMGHRDVTRQLA